MLSCDKSEKIHEKTQWNAFTVGPLFGGKGKPPRLMVYLGKYAVFPGDKMTFNFSITNPTKHNLMLENLPYRSGGEWKNGYIKATGGEIPWKKNTPSTNIPKGTCVPPGKSLHGNHPGAV